MGLKESVKGIAAAGLFLVGASPVLNAGNEKGVANAQTKHADEQVTPTVEQKKKRTPLGNPVHMGKGRHRFKRIGQKRKKHTNLNHKSHAAKVKRRKKR